MFTYVKYNKVQDEFTTHEFRGGDNDVIVNIFDGGVASIKCDDGAKVDELIAKQNPLIGVEKITKDEFKALVKDSDQLKVIRESVARRVALKYSFADELAMLKRSDDDVKKIAYAQYVAECVSYGDGLKLEIGY
jgi:hypothetical protein